jgi:L-iditol 2-dehydrogenase
MHTKALGAFAEYIILPSHVVRQNVFHKPAHLSFEEAAFLEPLSCVVHSVETLRITKGNSVLIIGAGPIGLLHLLLLKRKNAKVAVTDIKKERLNMAKRLGADFIVTINPPAPPFSKGGRGGIFKSGVEGLSGKQVWEDSQMEKFTNGIGFDYVFECTGIPDVWEASVNYARRGGAVILFGGCKSGTKVTYDTGKIHYDEITLKGVFHYTPADVKKAYHLLSEGKLGVSKLISGRYPLNKLQNAFNKLAQGEGIKYAIIPASS